MGGKRLFLQETPGVDQNKNRVPGRLAHICRLTVRRASGARSAGRQSGTGVPPVDARQAHGRDAHATCATANREMRQPDRFLAFRYCTEHPGRREMALYG